MKIVTIYCINSFLFTIFESFCIQHTPSTIKELSSFEDFSHWIASLHQGPEPIVPVEGGLGAIRPVYWVVLMLTELASVKEAGWCWQFKNCYKALETTSARQATLFLETLMWHGTTTSGSTLTPSWKSPSTLAMWYCGSSTPMDTFSMNSLYIAVFVLAVLSQQSYTYVVSLSAKTVESISSTNLKLKSYHKGDQ